MYRAITTVPRSTREENEDDEEEEEEEECATDKPDVTWTSLDENQKDAFTFACLVHCISGMTTIGNYARSTPSTIPGWLTTFAEQLASLLSARDIDAAAIIAFVSEDALWRWYEAHAESCGDDQSDSVPSPPPTKRARTATTAPTPAGLTTRDMLSAFQNRSTDLGTRVAQLITAGRGISSSALRFLHGESRLTAMMHDRARVFVDAACKLPVEDQTTFLRACTSESTARDWFEENKARTDLVRLRDAYVALVSDE
jgi:hypothetical protein